MKKTKFRRLAAMASSLLCCLIFTVPAYAQSLSLIHIYLFSRGSIGNSAAMFLMIGLMLPFFFLAMYERDGPVSYTHL